MPRPETGGRDEGLAPGEDEQILVARNQVINLCRLDRRQQGTPHGEIVRVPEPLFVGHMRRQDFGRDRQDVQQIVDLRRRKTVPMAKPRQNPAQRFEDEIRKNGFERAQPTS